MKLNKQKTNELERLYYFGGSVKNDLAQVTDKDIDDYFLFSERGIKPETETRGYIGLVEAKSWQGIHAHEMYEKGILDGSMPYYVILGGCDDEIVPRSVVDFLKKEMFKGIDADIIENCYQEIIKKPRINGLVIPN